MELVKGVKLKEEDGLRLLEIELSNNAMSEGVLLQPFGMVSLTQEKNKVLSLKLGASTNRRVFVSGLNMELEHDLDNGETLVYALDEKNKISSKVSLRKNGDVEVDAMSGKISISNREKNLLELQNDFIEKISSALDALKVNSVPTSLGPQVATFPNLDGAKLELEKLKLEYAKLLKEK